MTKKTDHKDFIGRTIEVGQWIAYPVRSGSSLTTEVGLVEKIRDNGLTVRKPNGNHGSVTSVERAVILPHPDRMMRVQYEDYRDVRCDERFPIWRGDLMAQCAAQWNTALSWIERHPEIIAELERNGIAIYRDPYCERKVRYTLLENPLWSNFDNGGEAGV